MDSIRGALTAEQAADMLGVTAARIRQLAQRGILPGVKRADAWFFTHEAVQQAISRQKSKGGRPPKK